MSYHVAVHSIALFWCPYVLFAQQTQRFSFKNPLLRTLRMVADGEDGDPRHKRVRWPSRVVGGQWAGLWVPSRQALLSNAHPLPITSPTPRTHLTQDLSMLKFHFKESGFELLYLFYSFSDFVHSFLLYIYCFCTHVRSWWLVIFCCLLFLTLFWFWSGTDSLFLFFLIPK